ncbi:hypothetical protein B0T24DRAFT_693595 [Lasiosphaeria ovina]|uniref:DUF3669 domain-containing protein n=1 Tax=Lasiosphaeria ovina TaxID=92902 RepID=A0AAE0JRJ4_9PEZI|nr:hypothetical protein B0T24DRAFT_693595 [Lasiosphaeria ovina]
MASTNEAEASSMDQSLARVAMERLHLEDRLEQEAAALETPDIILKRMLSIRSVVPTTSSFAQRQQGEVGTSSMFREIGTGSAGKVFEHPGTIFAYKVDVSGQPDKLWNNYDKHMRVYKSFDSVPYVADQVEIPRCFCLKLNANEMKDLDLPTSELCSSMARALAVLRWHTKIDAMDIEFVLGSSPLEEQKVRVDIETEDLRAMAPHTSTYEQATHNGPNFTKRITALWMLDFGNCTDITMDSNGVDMAVKAFVETNFYCPEPNSGNAFIDSLWLLFAESYIQYSDRILEDVLETPELQTLPREFIRKVSSETPVRRQESGSSSSAPGRGGTFGSMRGAGKESSQSSMSSSREQGNTSSRQRRPARQNSLRGIPNLSKTVWGEDADECIPERWENLQGETASPFAFETFRKARVFVCMGENLAIMKHQDVSGGNGRQVPLLREERADGGRGFGAGSAAAQADIYTGPS